MPETLERLVADFAKLVDKHGPRSDKAKEFIAKHRGEEGFRALAFAVILLKEGIVEELASQPQESNATSELDASRQLQNS